MKRAFLISILLLMVLFAPSWESFASQEEDVNATLLDKVVAVVNKEVITWIELYQTMEFELQTTVGSLSEEEKRVAFKQNEAAFLDSMIEQRLQLQEAERLNIEVGDEEVDSAMENIAQRYGKSMEEFEAGLGKEGMSLEKFRKIIQEQIIISRLVDREVKRKIELSSREARRELERMGLKEGTYYQLSQIFFGLGPGEQYERIESRVNASLDALRRGEPFAEVALRYSEGPAAQRGGDLGLLAEDQVSGEFKEALEGLSQGEISPPFRSSRGVHIVYYRGKHDARDVLLEKRFQGEYRDWLRKLRERSFVEVRL